MGCAMIGGVYTANFLLFKGFLLSPFPLCFAPLPLNKVSRNASKRNSFVPEEGTRKTEWKFAEEGRRKSVIW